MTKQNYTDITVILDRSGSMNSIREDIVGGFNTFVDEQKNVSGQCKLTLIQFDGTDPQEKIYDAMDVRRVPPLNDLYMPRGMTPLYDAVGRAIVNSGERFKRMSESERPNNVVFVIITDGLENCSQEYSRQRVFDMIQEQTNKWNWHFVFLGADQDSFLESNKLGVNFGTTSNWSKTVKGVKEMYGSTSENITKLRSGKTNSLAYSDEQRTAMSE